MHLLQGKEVDEEVDVFYTPAFAAGDVVAESLISNVLLSHTYHKPDVVRIIKALTGMPSTVGKWRPFDTHSDNHAEEESRQGLSPVRLSSLSVPLDFIGQTFGDLFQFLLLNRATLALGLLRAPDPQDFGNQIPFVYCNPVASLVLKESDSVYILDRLP